MEIIDPWDPGDTATMPVIPDDSSRWRLAVLCLASFLSAVNFFATSPFLPAIADELGTSVPLLGQAVTLMLITSAALGLVAGPLADARGYRRLLVVGILAITANLVGTAFAPSYLVLLGFSLVGALGDALVFGLTLALAGTLYTGEARRRAMSWTIASLSTGAIVGIPALTTIGDLLGWRIAIATFGIASLAIAWLALAVLPADPPPTGARFQVGSLQRAYAPLLRSAPVMRLLAITVLRSVWFLGAITFLGAFLDEELGLSTREVGFAYMLGGVGSTVGSIVAGARWFPLAMRPAVALGNVGGGILLFAIFRAPTAPVALGMLAPATAVASISGVAVATLLMAESPAQAGTTMAFNATLINAGAAVGAAVCGILISLSGYHALAAGLPAFAFAAALLAAWPTRRNA